MCGALIVNVLLQSTAADFANTMFSQHSPCHMASPAGTHLEACTGAGEQQSTPSPPLDLAKAAKLLAEVAEGPSVGPSPAQPGASFGQEVSVSQLALARADEDFLARAGDFIRIQAQVIQRLLLARQSMCVLNMA